jgi:ABC-2 type transport system permease protein
MLRNRVRIVDNHLSSLHSHLLVHLLVFVGVVVFLIATGTAFFHLLFYHVSTLEDIGNMLMNKLVGMVIMAFFTMLVFSNLIITLSTTYISNEIPFYMTQPIHHKSIFFVKLLESTVYSSWAFAILSLPFFLSFGMVRDVSVWFYVGILVALVPFLMIPSAIGAIITMVLSAIIPARKAAKWSVVLILLAIVAAFVIVRVSGAGSMITNPEGDDFARVLIMMRAGEVLWSPHAWMSSTVLSLGEGDYRGAFYWFGLLLSTALFLVQICMWLAPRLYFRGYCLARVSPSGRGGRLTPGQRVFAWLERRFDGEDWSPRWLPMRNFPAVMLEPGNWLPLVLFFPRLLLSRLDRLLKRVDRTSKALFFKDLKTFFRDPAQWSQIVILLGILIIYMANLRSDYINVNPKRFFGDKWTIALMFFNLGVTCFILSIMTTRFVYPMLSLEGKQYWAIGLAPVPRERIVWEKYALCWMVSFFITEGLMIFSSVVLKVNPGFFILSCLAVLLVSFGLTSLAIGLGAISPNFRQDNPARIANGLGGTLNVILSLGYIGAIMACFIVPVYYRQTGIVSIQTYNFVVLPLSVVCALIIQSMATIVPMRVGLRRWRNMEF